MMLELVKVIGEACLRMLNECQAMLLAFLDP